MVKLFPDQSSGLNMTQSLLTSQQIIDTENKTEREKARVSNCDNCVGGNTTTGTMNIIYVNKYTTICLCMGVWVWMQINLHKRG